jgi:methylmalonyl-CoA mutase N-terminal domain/subunit
MKRPVKRRSRAKSLPRRKAKGSARPSGLHDAKALRQLEKRLQKWREAAAPDGERLYRTDSGIPIPDVLTPLDVKDVKDGEPSLPGEYPFTRGVQPSMYRGRLWTMRQFAGFGSPEDTNSRFQYLLAQGVTGLSTAFDMPALMGYDADHPMSLGEVGKEGVAISTLRDFEILFGGLPLDKVTTSMTINASAIVAFCMYLAVAQKQGIALEKLGGTLQNDMLKEYVAQKEWIVPPRPAVRISADIIEFCARHMPRWHAISISGYHIREAGATAVQELAFTLADGIAYVEECARRGMEVDQFAPRLSFFFDVHNDFFEEVAKFRAARRLWAGIMRDRFGAKNARSMQLRTHAQTAGVSLTAQQPYNNVVRTALQAFAAVLGGTQSLHTNSLDETYALPTEAAATLALRTQQIIACETGADRVVDPLAGSYYVEYLTNEMQARAEVYIRRIDEMGGMIRAVEEGFPQREIAETAYRHQREMDRGERKVVGVNAFVQKDGSNIPTLKVDESVQRRQIERVRETKASRDGAATAAALARLDAAARGAENLVPFVLDAVTNNATLGEVCDVFRKVWGTHRESGHL